ncbi:MAG: hypothetical protein JF626_02300 [Polaromonas sp.]|nr:hypothetical protein [Polaromonas sp.]
MISKILRFFLKLVLGLFAAVFAVSLLIAALIVVVLSVLKSLVTGRKPAPAVVFGRFQRYSPQGMWPGGPSQGHTASSRPSDVVDVEVREVRDDKRLP